MNPYPQDKSILILDNCAIHKTRVLREIVEGLRLRSTFLTTAALRISIRLRRASAVVCLGKYTNDYLITYVFLQ